MKLFVYTPAAVMLEETVLKFSAECSAGSFTLLPRHLDLVTDLVPCVASFVVEGGSEVFAALDQGVLVKVDDQVSVSVRAGVLGDSLETLADTVRERFRTESEEERKLRSAMADVEAGMVRRFMEIDRG
ncbi:MAG: F0F1 ATP synthase subunit epsilon [Desulfovibrionaceae bacterium]